MHPPGDQPHRDPTTWSGLVDSLDAASIFVVLATWIGPKLERHISVEDVWQETLWMAWRDRGQHEWRGLAAWRSWLLSIAKHRIHDAVRHHGRQKRGGGQEAEAFSVLAGPDSVSGYLPPDSVTPSRIAGHHERSLLMRRALAALEPELREMVHLRLFEEVPMREAAERLRLPLSTAKDRLVRGVLQYRMKLREHLRGDTLGQAEVT
jgi:RNA polymerase sigma factor (sigma-70 family)